MSLYMYKEKYTKYKNKYLELKKQLGGIYGPGSAVEEPNYLEDVKQILRDMRNFRDLPYTYDLILNAQGAVFIVYGNYHLSMFSNEIGQNQGHITENNTNNHYFLRYNQNNRRSVYRGTNDINGYPTNNSDREQMYHLKILFEDIFRTLYYDHNP